MKSISGKTLAVVTEILDNYENIIFRFNMSLTASNVRIGKLYIIKYYLNVKGVYYLSVVDCTIRIFVAYSPFIVVFWEKTRKTVSVTNFIMKHKC